MPAAGERKGDSNYETLHFLLPGRSRTGDQKLDRSRSGCHCPYNDVKLTITLSYETLQLLPTHQRLPYIMEKELCHPQLDIAEVSGRCVLAVFYCRAAGHRRSRGA